MEQNSELLDRLRRFAERENILLLERLGRGVQGMVFAGKTQGETGQWGRFAIKIHERETAYLRERDAYVRLESLGITEVRGCQVPELIGYSDRDWIVAMTIVPRPFVLDFGSAHLDRPPEFPEEVMADWLVEKQEQYGGDWPAVQAVLREFAGHGIFLEDVKPDNICVR